MHEGWMGQCRARKKDGIKLKGSKDAIRKKDDVLVQR